MHILNVATATLEDLVEPVDLGQRPAEMAALSFSDSDLAALAGAWDPALPELRLTALRDLRHPMSVDLWIDREGGHLVRMHLDGQGVEVDVAISDLDDPSIVIEPPAPDEVAASPRVVDLGELPSAPPEG